jgi:hypothetical protein
LTPRISCASFSFAASACAYCFANKQTADHGARPCFPFDSGNIDINLRNGGKRFNRAAVLKSERISIGFQPNGWKNAGPSGGPNYSGAFAFVK